jgi:thioredoxin reductase (NADPH)
MTWDCIVIGSGPAGLTAALYLARFRRRVLVVHDGTARALRIPRTYNAPGFPDGIAGIDLLERMTEHAMRYGADVTMAEVVEARTADGEFRIAAADGQTWSGRSLVLATGNRLNEAPLPDAEHEMAIAAGTLRYCPICDAQEHVDQRIGVIGCDSPGAGEAMFLSTYSSRVTLIPMSWPELSEDEREQLSDAGIAVVPHSLDRLEPAGPEMRVHLVGEREPLVFDVVYPALGTRPRSELAEALGLEPDQEGKLSLRSPFGTAVPGLFAAGDVVDGLDQISVAMGHGAISATRAHNWLRTQEGATL